MHYAKNMVGAAPANQDAPLWKRYFRLSNHKKPGRIKRAFGTLELLVGVFAYG